MMCEFEYIYPGEIVTFNITDPCRSCGVISNAIRTLRYEGHITNGIVYDLFIDIEGGLTCPSCGTSWTGWAKPCWSGGSWDIAELTQVVTGDSLGAAAKGNPNGTYQNDERRMVRQRGRAFWF